MLIKHIRDMAPQQVPMDGVKDVTIREVFTGETGAPNFAMRIFDVAPGGFTPRHHHPYEHEVLIMAGQGEVQTSRGATPFNESDAIYISPDEEHQFKNTGSHMLRFVCMIPIQHDCVAPEALTRPLSHVERDKR